MEGKICSCQFIFYRIAWCVSEHQKTKIPFALFFSLSPFFSSSGACYYLDIYLINVPVIECKGRSRNREWEKKEWIKCQNLSFVYWDWNFALNTIFNDFLLLTIKRDEGGKKKKKVRMNFKLFFCVLMILIGCPYYAHKCPYFDHLIYKYCSKV